ncbi:adhesion G protein-coupled receptor E1-like isoform X1 [Erpetoichthys calabaricus]|uniref:adhesion G protein-coupled receptor E1-like isoform X1 n=1 Tax=Erpetoichthys calabaricus TaxID=27687 RepID=UPI002234B33A|nr:adhesion G protein-coupled receptor E1-like isoform X1 [Erpetoichthys calabaricus]
MNLRREQKRALLLWLLSLVLPTFSQDHMCEEEFFEKVAQCSGPPANGSGHGLDQCAIDVSCQVSTQFTLDVDNCQLFPGLCGSNANCTNTDSGYYCSCRSGYLPSTGITWIVNETQCQGKPSPCWGLTTQTLGPCTRDDNQAGRGVDHFGSAGQSHLEL